MYQCSILQSLLTSIQVQVLHAGLTRVKCPWVLGTVNWKPQVVKQAVVWLARLLKKPILKLTDPDYNENSLQACEPEPPFVSK